MGNPAIAAVVEGSANKNDARDDIKSRLSIELVIAMVGPVASGVSKTAVIIRDILADRFRYEAGNIIKVSRFLQEDAHLVDLSPTTDLRGNDRIESLQMIGNELRKRHGPDYLAKRAVAAINEIRTSGAGLERISGEAPPRAARVRRVCVIDSLKNDAELALLRDVYKDMLVVVGVFAPDYVRLRRMKEDGSSDAGAGAILDRDQGEVIPHGQKTRSVFGDADFFIRNDGDNDTELLRTVNRFLDIVFDVGVHTPTRAEQAMHEADAVAHRSACMSRQVGAAIFDTKGDLISVGWNDVPKPGGGLYGEDDQWGSDAKGSAADRDNRCFRFGQRICHNDHEKDEIRAELLRNLRKAEIIKDDVPDAKVAEAIRGSRLDWVIEFSRSIHAEMEAILAVARDGRHSLVGSTLYTTVYPCHNCARHIVAAGIAEVVFIQPYKKSMATKLHHDSLTEEPRGENRTLFRQYGGVAPKHFARLFRQRSERKSDGHARASDPASAEPVFRQPLDSFVAYELRVAKEMGEIERAAVTTAPTGGR